MSNSFESLNLKTALLENLKTLNFSKMTPIQEKSLPHILEGKDIIAQAKTGSGKTAAFGLGLLNALNIENVEVQSLILCPTRELAEQVTSELRRLSRSLPNVKILSLCGGVSESLQLKSLFSGVHIVVGTPGRVLQHLSNDHLDIDNLKNFTLDEADRMLDMGFEEELKDIISYLPSKKQSLLFSATYPDNIRTLSESVQNDAVEVKVDTVHEEDNITQVFYEVKPDEDKNSFLYALLSFHKPNKVIVFCRTKKETKDVSDFLENRSIYAKCLNGDLEQKDRTEVLTKFANSSISVLVATDVAARGIDINDLEMVINYNMPSGADAYVHRIGRTGRAGKKGLAFSFFNPVEEFRLEEIEELVKKPCLKENIRKVTYSKRYNLKPPMKTIYISGGKQDKIRKGDILGALTGEAKVSSRHIGRIDVFNAFSFVAIDKNAVDKAVTNLSKTRIKKKKFKVGFA